jgi:PAS domain S-box-containing protein
MLVGGVIGFSALPRVCLAFVLPILIAVMASIFMTGRLEHLALAAMLFLFFLTTAIAQREAASAVSAGVAARYAQELLSEILDLMPQGFAVYDAEDRLFICNDAYRDTLPNLREMIVPGVKLEDLTRAGAEKGLVADPIGNVEAYVDEQMAQHRDPQGPHEYYQTRSHWIRTRGQRLPDGSTIVIRQDISEQKLAEDALKQSEKRFRDFAEASADWFWETDAEHRFTFVSENFETLTGVPIASLLGRTRLEVSIGDDNTEVWHEHLETLQQRKPFRDFTFRRVAEVEEAQWVSVSGIPVFAEDGTFLGYRGTGSDITDHVLAERLRSQ